MEIIIQQTEQQTIYYELQILPPSPMSKDEL